MKKTKKLKIILTILVIVLISLISFLGIYVQKQHKMVNILPEYLLGMEFNKSRNATIKVDSTVEKNTYDQEGNLIKEEDKQDDIEYTTENGYTIEEIPVNKAEILTSENFNKSKSVIQKRLKEMGVNEYELRLDEEGAFVFELPENEQTNNVIGSAFAQGKFEMIDSEDKTVLLDNSHIKNAQVMYNTVEDGTDVYLNIKFNKEGAKKLEEISQKYIQTTVEVEATEEEEAHTDTVTKNVAINIDEQEILNTYFGEKMSNGEINITVGNTTSDSEKLQENIIQASQLAMLLKFGELPIVYTTESNEVVNENIGEKQIEFMALCFAMIQLVLIVVFIIRFRSKGILASIMHVGFLALLLLVIRFTNVILTIEGFIAILIMSVLYWICLYSSIKEKNETNSNEMYIKTIIKLIPLYIIAVIWCFASWLPLASFGMVMFWGFAIQAIYNLVLIKIFQ